VLIDAGVAPKLVESRLLELGITLQPGTLHGIIATHQHGDHFSYTAKLATPIRVSRVRMRSRKQRSTCGAMRWGGSCTWVR